MAISYHIDPDRKRVEVTVTEVLSYKDALQIQRQIAQDPRFVPELSLLVDLQGMTAMQMSGDEMRSLIHATPFDSNTKRALVYGDRVASFGISRMYQINTDDRFPNLRLFKTRSEGLAWLTEPASETDSKSRR